MVNYKFMKFIKKYWKWIVGIILIILLSLFLIHESFKERFMQRIEFLLEVGTYKEEEFIILDIETTNVTLNYTDRLYLDTIVKIGLKQMGLDDNIVVSIRPISDEIQQRFDSEMILQAHIMGKGNQYALFVDDMSRYEAIKVISHELVHLKQYRSEKLILNKNSVIWDGREYSEWEINDMDYMRRPWEREAYDEQRWLSSTLNELLYER